MELGRTVKLKKIFLFTITLVLILYFKNQSIEKIEVSNIEKQIDC